MSADGQIRRDPFCFDYNFKRTDLLDSSKIYLYSCKQPADLTFQKWSFENSLIKHLDTGLCMELHTSNHELISLKTCNSTNKYQQWTWPKRVPKLTQHSVSLSNEN
jgi:hypothetical protein